METTKNWRKLTNIVSWRHSIEMVKTFDFDGEALAIVRAIDDKKGECFSIWKRGGLYVMERYSDDMKSPADAMREFMETWLAWTRIPEAEAMKKHA